MKILLILISIILVGCNGTGGGTAQDGIFAQPKMPDSYAMTDLPTASLYTDASLQPFVNEFEGHASDYDALPFDKDTHVQFGWVEAFDSSAIGVCQTFGNANRVIVKKDWWDRVDITDNDRRSLIFHELGHCALARGHRTLYWQGIHMTSQCFGIGGSSYNKCSDGIFPIHWGNSASRVNWPVSLMHRSIVRDARYTAETDYYIFELFNEYNLANNALNYAQGNCLAHFDEEDGLKFEEE